MPPRVSVPHPALVELNKHASKQRRQLEKAKKIACKAYVRTDVATTQRQFQEYSGNLTTQGRENLDRFERAMYYLFEKCGVVMGFLQQQILDIGRLILLKRMFGDSIATELRYLRERFNISRLFEQAAVTLPRRSGKTVAQTLLAVVVAVSQPDGNVCNFNLLGRQAVSWLGKVLVWLKMYEKSPEFAFAYVKINAQEYVVIRNCTGTLAMISSYPGPRDEDASNFRGMGDKLMLLMYDEFYFLKEIVYPTTLPLSINGAAILMVSSMSKNGDSPIRRMIYKEIDGNPLFYRLDAIRACPECHRAGKSNECTHIEQRPQHFQPRGSLRRQRHLMEPFGSEGFERELLNIMARNNVEPVFHPELLALFRSNEHDFVPQSIHSFKEIMIGYDPAVNSGFSEAVAVGMIFDQDTPPPGLDRRAIIVSAERVPDTAYNQIADWLVNHGLKVRQKLNLPAATIVICIENNSPIIARNIAVAIQTLRARNVVVMHETKVFHRSGQNIPLVDNRPGIHTTHANKEAGINALRSLLLAGALHFHRDFFVPNKDRMRPEDAMNTRQKVADEFSTMSAIYIEPKNKTALTGSKRQTGGGGSGGVKYAGYGTGGQRAQDDYVMAVIFCILCWMPFRISNQFHAYTAGISTPPPLTHNILAATSNMPRGPVFAY